MNLVQSQFVGLLKKEAGPRLPRILLFGVVSGVFEALSVVCINGAVANIGEEGLNFRYLGLFATSIALYLYGDRYVLAESLSVAGQMIYDTQLRIARKMGRSSALEFERLERPKIYSALIENTDIIIEATRYLADGISNVTMVAISAVYIYSLSTDAFLMVLLLDAIALYLFVYTQRSVSAELAGIKRLNLDFLTLVNHILFGFNELKVNKDKQTDLVENHISLISSRAKKQKILTEIRSSTSFLYTRSFFFILVACVVFLLPRMNPTETTTITAIVAVVLFSIGPLGQIVLGIPFFTKAELAVASIRQLEEKLDEINDVRATSPESRMAGKQTFQSLRMEQLSFSYTDPEGQQTFTVGPIDMTIGKGELIIIAGGNGSGKTTLLKLIAGLYYSVSGSIYLDDILVKPSNYEHYRKLFSIILSDFHIFDRLYGLDDIDYDQFGYLMDKMQLSKKTAYIDGRFSNLDLSAGQKKRLALVTSCLEDKPILIYDEIAADLDPEFRAYYYDVHLKELRKSGKTIIVVSHDDRYFHMGDRFFKMDYGRIVMEERHKPDLG